METHPVSNDRTSRVLNGPDVDVTIVFKDGATVSMTIPQVVAIEVYVKYDKWKKSNDGVSFREPEFNYVGSHGDKPVYIDVDFRDTKAIFVR